MRSSDIDDTSYTGSGRGRNFFSRYLLSFILFIFCIFCLNIHKIYGFSIYPDEFGYWACAAQTAGCDWSQMASLGSYYSFGYSLILLPVLMLCRDSVTAYRAAVTINMILQCASVFLLCGIFQRWYPGGAPEQSEEALTEKRSAVLFATGCAVFYPAWSFYAQTTLAEGLLTFLYVLICYQFILWMEKPKMSGAVMLALSLLYLYFVHMRTVGVVSAAAAVLFLYVRRRPSCRKMLFAMAVIFFTGVLCGLFLKERIMDTVYAASDPGILSVNDYTGQMEKVKKLFSMQGMGKLFLSCAGKFYYLVLASFGLICPALCRLGKGILQAGKRRYFALFLLLSFTGQFMVTAVNGIEPGRLDGIVYGRYNEYLLPVFLGMGLPVFCKNGYRLREFVKSVVVSVVFTAVLSGITFLNALHSGLSVMQGYFAPGISYLSDDWHYDIREEFPKSFFFGICLILFVWGCAFAGKKFRNRLAGRSAFGVVVAVEIVLILCLQKKYTWLFNDVNYYNLQIYEYVMEYDLPVFYLHEGGIPYVNLIQFAMRDQKIEIIAAPQEKRTDENFLEKELPKQAFLIAGSQSAYLDEIGRSCEKCMENGMFVLFVSQSSD